jgi:hypothetical protein
MRACAKGGEAEWRMCMRPELVKGEPWLEPGSRDAGVAEDAVGATDASGADLARGAPGASAAATGSGKSGACRAPGSGIDNALF